MRSILHFPSYRRTLDETRPYATDDDFEQLFVTEMTDFFRLSLQLTANAERAERCLIHAMRDSFRTSTIARGFTRVWARRMVMLNAIRLVLGIDTDPANDTDPEFHLQPSKEGMEEMRESVAILELPDFERLAFVICVLERVSVLDCALQLRRSPKDVSDAIVRATNRVASAESANLQKSLQHFESASLAFSAFQR